MTTAYPIRTFEYATILNVVDGDTCDIEIDLGFSVKVKHRFRLANINTPERGEEDFATAKNYLASYLNDKIIVKSTKLDKYGRYLAELFTMDGLNINEEMLKLGLAVPYV